MMMDKMKVFLSSCLVLLMVALAIGLLVAGPFIVAWAVSTFFDVSVEVKDFWDWFAGIVLIVIFSGASRYKRGKNDDK